jgi:hypothetical protein
MIYTDFAEVLPTEKPKKLALGLHVAALFAKKRMFPEGS